MILQLLRFLGRIVLRIFFRRVAISGSAHLPPTGPVILIANHPNALVDPLFFLALVPRRIAFLAKATLFRMPVIGWVVRATGAISVQRHQDAGADLSLNKGMFEQVHRVLHAGGAVALFPEGVSHDEPVQRPFKTGAARLALGAASTSPTGTPIQILPVGLYYTAKAIFRSSAVLTYGRPIMVSGTMLDAAGEPPRELVQTLTARLEYALAEVTLHADQHEVMDLIGRAERLFSSASGGMRRERELVDQLALRRRLLDGYSELRSSNPARLAQLAELITRYETELQHEHLAPESLVPTSFPRSRLVVLLLRRLLPLVVTAPLAVIGIVVHYPAWRITHYLSRSMSKGSLDMVATIKILASAALYPLSWLLFGLLVGGGSAGGWGVVAMLIAPLAGWAAMFFLEQVTFAAGEWRAVVLMLRRPSAFQHLMAERRQLREVILGLDQELA